MQDGDMFVFTVKSWELTLVFNLNTKAKYDHDLSERIRKVLIFIGIYSCSWKNLVNLYLLVQSR